MPLTDNLEAFWELEEASGTRNDSHSSNHLTDANTVTQNTGKVGNCAQFTDTNSEYLNRNDNAALSWGNTDGTLQFWVYADTLNGSSGFPVVGSKGSPFVSVANEWVVYYDFGASRWNFAIADGNGLVGVIANNAGAASTGTWYCIHVWHDSVNDLIGIAVNAGTPNTQGSVTLGVSDSNADFVIGAAPDQGLYWNGRIDQVGFWRRVLTSQDRTDLYNSGNGLSYAAMVGGDVATFLPPRRDAKGLRGRRPDSRKRRAA